MNIFTIEGNTEPDRQTPMWGRGRIDHFGLQAADADAFARSANGSSRLVRATAPSTTSAALSIFFRDPDGLEGEVLIRK